MTVQEKRKRAIECIEYFINAHAWTSDEAEDLGYALELLKGPEPIEPHLLVKDANFTNGVKYICGGCGGSFFHQKVNYCPWCGMLVKWE